MNPSSKRNIKYAVIFLIGFTSFKAVDIAYDNIMTSKTPLWDRVEKHIFSNPFGKDFSVVDIESSLDGAIQKAYFYKSTHQEPQPLILSLHTWSGDYSQEDPIAKLAKDRNWNYIHPDARGSNNNPESCLSPKVISDLDDAIQFSKANSKISGIYIIGVSGGGYAALGYYMKGRQHVDKILAWVPISSLTDWYNESVINGSKYADDVLGCVSDKTNLDEKLQSAKERSPINFDQTRNDIKLEIYAGINDSYIGSVSTLHSMNFFNKIAQENKLEDHQIISILSRNSTPLEDEDLGGRKVYLNQKSENTSITIFDGAHEMLPEVSILSIEDELKA